MTLRVRSYLRTRDLVSEPLVPAVRADVLHLLDRLRVAIAVLCVVVVLGVDGPVQPERGRNEKGNL